MKKPWLFIDCGGCSKRFLTVFLILAVFRSACPATARSAVTSSAGSRLVENPSVYNPVGISTVPPSSIGRGLIDSSNPIDTNGNLIVTGNVRRGSHFRGTVPYQSTTSFSASLGTSSLSSFLRDAAGPQDYGVYSGSYRVQPYYSQEETVTTMSPGSSGVLKPAGTRIDGRMTDGVMSTGTDVFGLEVLPRKSLTGEAAGESSTYDLGTLPLGTHYRSSTEPQSEDGHPQASLEAATRSIRDGGLSQQDRVNSTVQTTEFGWPSRTEGVFDLQVSGKQSQPDNTERDMLSGLEEDSTLTVIPDVQNRIEPPISQQGEDLSASFVQSQVGDAELKLEESDDLMANQSSTLPVDTQYAEFEASNQQRRDALERMRQQLDDLTRSIEDTITGPQERGDGNAELITGMELRLDSQPQGIGPDRRESRQSYGLPTTDFSRPDSMSVNEPGDADVPVPEAVQGVTGRQDLELTQTPGVESAQKMVSPLEKLEELSDEELSVRARRIMGPHTSLDSFSQAKFNQHFQDGQLYLTAGRYYQAAGSFDMALIYKPNDPFCLAGKGHALFAAGEYVSSALFISRALELSPEYIQNEVDLAAILGGDEKVEKRIADIEEWLTKSGSDQLGFLLSYVYYQTGKLDKAKLAIDVISQKMPQSPAVQVMKTVITNSKNKM